MYFLTALACTIISAILWLVFRKRKLLHLDILTIIYGSSTLMWLIDCIFSAAKGEGFITFDDPIDGWIALATFVVGIFLWLVVSFIMNNSKKAVEE